MPIKKTRPFLKWAGSKYRCLDKLLGSFIPAKRLIEPFSGSAAVFLNTDYPSYLLAESNHDLIYLFQSLQNDGHAFIQFCKALFIPENNSRSKYYQLRDEFNQSTDPYYKSALFLYLNRHGYNGLCRYNQSKKYNVPYGRYLKPYFPEAEMTNFHKKAKTAEIKHQDFIETFAYAEPDDLIYCDPPYAPINQISNFSNYTHAGFNEKDQLLLAELAVKTSQRGVTVIISNHDTPVTRSYYQSANLISSFPVSRTINSKITQRQPVKELLAVFMSHS